MTKTPWNGLPREVKDAVRGQVGDITDMESRLSETPCPEIPLRDMDLSAHARPEDTHRFSGRALAHSDLNPGNVRITADGHAYLLDWARYMRTVSWWDAASFAQCLMTCGHTPYDAEGILEALPVWKTIGPGDLDAVAYYQSAVRSTWKPRLDPWTNASVAAARRWHDYRMGLEPEVTGRHRPASRRPESGSAARTARGAAFLS